MLRNDKNTALYIENFTTVLQRPTPRSVGENQTSDFGVAQIDSLRIRSHGIQHFAPPFRDFSKHLKQIYVSVSMIIGNQMAGDMNQSLSDIEPFRNGPGLVFFKRRSEILNSWKIFRIGPTKTLRPKKKIGGCLNVNV